MSNIDSISGTYYIEYPGRAETPNTSAAQQPGTDFSAMLADAMRDGIMQTTMTAGGGMSGLPGYMPIQNSGIEQAILEAATSGQVDDAQIALFMLMMMMQTNQGGDFSMLMQMMATMITQLQGDTSSLRDNAMASRIDPYVLDAIDRGVFSWVLPDGTVTNSAVMPVEQWRPTTPVITSNVHNRSPDLYRAVVGQFQVETAERYRPFRNGNTYCNIFVWDVTSAMGAELPLYTVRETGEPRFYPNTRGARSMGAIAMCSWLSTHGARYGWREVDAPTAQAHANRGRPAITSAGSLGHVQMVVPSREGGFDPSRGVTIAQAGRTNTNYTHISSIYSGNALNNSVRYWIHD